MRYYNKLSSLIGQTPLVRFGEINGAEVFLKLEGQNPTGSVKDRLAQAVLDDAESRGILVRGESRRSIVEPTSGNTGIGLAAQGVERGYRVVLTMPETMSVERRNLLLAYGAELILTPGSLGMKGAIAEAQRLLESDPDSYFMPQQFENMANVVIHEETTGPEIYRDLEGEFDVFVAGVGTGGTLSGVGRFMKKHCRASKVIAVEPESSQAIAQSLAGQTLALSSHGIQGIGAGFVPKILDLSLLDGVEAISTEQAKDAAKRLIQRYGISSGISGGANFAVAERLAKRGDFKGKKIVTVIPDRIDKYMSLLQF